MTISLARISAGNTPSPQPKRKTPPRIAYKAWEGASNCIEIAETAEAAEAALKG
jgi:hypothetical protein